MNRKERIRLQRQYMKGEIKLSQLSEKLKEPVEYDDPTGSSVLNAHVMAVEYPIQPEDAALAVEDSTGAGPKGES